LRKITFLGRKIPVPKSLIVRVLLGVVFVFGGLLSFLPVFGIWMLPLGLLILSIDIPIARRIKRRVDVALGRRLLTRSPTWAKRLRYGSRSSSRSLAKLLPASGPEIPC
jgi:hypothetical protein